MKNAMILSLMFAACACTAQAQQPKIPFKPGEWKVDSTMVMNNGQPMNTEMQVCLANPEDSWKQKRADQVCGPVQITAAAGGAIHVQMHCKGGSGKIVSETKVDMVTHFSSNGDAYTESGTSTSSTTIPGRPPMMMNIQMKGQGTRVGPCTSPAAKP